MGSMKEELPLPSPKSSSLELPPKPRDKENPAPKSEGRNVLDDQQEVSDGDQPIMPLVLDVDASPGPINIYPVAGINLLMPPLKLLTDLNVRILVMKESFHLLRIPERADRPIFSMLLHDQVLLWYLWLKCRRQEILGQDTPDIKLALEPPREARKHLLSVD